MDRIDALRLLIDVAEMGSFSAVARQRTVATSSVTLAVNQLEDEVGATLITRTTRRLVFTHEGVALLNKARHIVDEWDETLANLKQEGPLTGPIRVTATNDFGRIQLRPLLDRFQSLHPGVHVSLLLSDTTLDPVTDHIDLAVRNGPLVNSGMHARLLVRGERLVCASPDYWQRRGKPAIPDDLTHHNCLILARPGAPLVAWPFRVSDKHINVKVSGDRQASDGGVLREWAVAGLGVVVKNRWDIRAELMQGALETALDDYVAGSIDLYAVYPAAVPGRRVAALIRFLSTELAGL
ncbi:LysR family transcriptional regulator [Paraburkholderia rhizosphaerae]|uniref:DNA-binding transcriptional LysR family regulator n=1 Tax=Paraburkholderia rhizosphaerae TaxID=480658 RepID=A0A4R8LU10_9BURK|nr:LysR family transcriptional regulator [Paraburkholderia rhizosphaerae]TDY51008.1 DNA-binding transcriptional LysR family regulator [Paraburkholderia rhizosphaerae]